jgi:hypothetical protein
MVLMFLPQTSSAAILQPNAAAGEMPPQALHVFPKNQGCIGSAETE